MPPKKMHRGSKVFIASDFYRLIYEYPQPTPPQALPTVAGSVAWSQANLCTGLVLHFLGTL